MYNKSKIQVDYTTKTKNLQLVFPINFEIIIPADDSVRLLSNVLEEIDYTELYRAYVWKKTILKHQAKLQDKMHKELPALLDKYGFNRYNEIQNIKWIYIRRVWLSFPVAEVFSFTLCIIFLGYVYKKEFKNL